jgi:hypothetical protein
MVRYLSFEVTSVSKFDVFLRQALSDITGEEILVHSVSRNKDLIPYISHKLAKETGLDSCDIAAWILRSLKQYWTDMSPTR